ncbi:MAG: metallophosphoesterase family protein [Limisphaerales bacterium]
MRIGLIADTHDHLDARVAGLFDGVHHILHAGDVGHPTLISELELIAPVTVVAGNNDSHPGWRETEVREFAGTRILVEHIVNPHALSPAFRQRLVRSQAHIVVFGHSHRAFSGVVDNVHFINPGSAGDPRHGRPASVGILHLGSKPTRAVFLGLDGRTLAG